MRRKPDDTADYGDPAAKSERPRRAGVSSPSPGESTKPGVGIDRVRPPQSIAPRKRAVGQPIAVALAMHDHYERASTARALILAGCNVDLVTSTTQVPNVNVLVADFDAPDVFVIVENVRSEHPGVPIVAWTARREEVEGGLARMKFEPFAVLDRRSRVNQLLEAIQRLAAQ